MALKKTRKLLKSDPACPSRNGKTPHMSSFRHLFALQIPPHHFLFWVDSKI